MEEQNLIAGDTYYEVRLQNMRGSRDNVWWWHKEDTGAWKGPVSDWNESHYDKYVAPIQKKSIVVTAGANMGLYARCYAEMFDRVIAFEPEKSNFHALVRNCYANNVTFFNAALGREAGWCNIKPSSQQNNHGMHGVEFCGNGTTPVMTVDGLNLPDLALLQLDCEGSEADVIAGALETIRKYSPVVVTEGNHGMVVKHLENLGYEHQGTSKADYIWRKKNEQTKE